MALEMFIEMNGRGYGFRAHRFPRNGFAISSRDVPE
jgi:hypothetical protein